MHYPSDVLGGVALGLWLGRAVPGLGHPPTEDRLVDLAVDANESEQASRRVPGNGGAAAAAVAGPRTQARSGVKIGIVGLPNAGKSTLFNALTRAGAETGDYPFTTIDPNVAVVGVPDERLERAAAESGASRGGPGDDPVPRHRRVCPRRLAGGGLGQPVPRRDPRDRRDLPRRPQPTPVKGYPIPSAAIDPLDDIELIETELLAADLEQAERRLERVSKQARSLDREAIAERDWLEAVVDALAAGARRARCPCRRRLRTHRASSRP